MYWSIPVLAAALGLSAVSAVKAQNDAGISAPNTAAPGTTGTGTDPGNAFDAARTTAPETYASHDARTSRLIGMEVRDSRGEELGEIQDLILDVKDQRVHYAVLAFGGFLGMGEKLFAYPMRSFRQPSGADHLVLDVNRERLREAPGFERNRWPDFNSEGYREQVERFHGKDSAEAAQRKRPGNLQLVRASELLGRSVNDIRGNDAGEVEDIVVNLRDGKVRYMVMEFDRAWNPNDKLLPLPLSAFEVPPRKDIDLRLAVDRKALNMAHGFKADRWPNLNDPLWQRKNEEWLGGMNRPRERGRDAAY